MKKFIFLSLLIAAVSSSRAQQPTEPNAVIKSDYLQKSKNQKTAAWVLLGGGFALDVIGVAVSATNWYSSAGDVLLIIGTASMLGSIPLFIASSKNKRRAGTVSAFLNIEKEPILQKNAFVRKSYPALSVTVSL